MLSICRRQFYPTGLRYSSPMHASALAPCVRPFFADFSLSRWGKLFPPLTTDEGPLRPFRPISVLCNAEIYGPIGRGALSIRRGLMRGRGWNWNIDSCLSKGCRRILAVFSLSSIYFASASRRLERSQRTRIHLHIHHRKCRESGPIT